MSDDRTTPMQTPPGRESAKPRPDTAQPGQETLAGGADPNGGLTPTIQVPPGQEPRPAPMKSHMQVFPSPLALMANSRCSMG